MTWFEAKRDLHLSRPGILAATAVMKSKWIFKEKAPQFKYFMAELDQVQEISQFWNI
jgi:hypothetical protein